LQTVALALGNKSDFAAFLINHNLKLFVYLNFLKFAFVVETIKQTIRSNAKTKTPNETIIYVSETVVFIFRNILLNEGEDDESRHTQRRCNKPKKGLVFEDTLI